MTVCSALPRTSTSLAVDIRRSKIRLICVARRGCGLRLKLRSVKALTREQLESRKAQAVRFVRDVLEDDERADEIEDESLEDYAERRRIQIVNPKGARKMAQPNRRELLDRIEELEAENEDLQSRFDEIGDIIGERDEDSGEDDDQGEE